MADFGIVTSPSNKSKPFRFSEGEQWLRDFEKRSGRPLRVLHIGNIANNAYNNAKIQRERGIDAYVLALENFHIMATPEWEDSGFTGEIADHFFPDWWSVKLNGFHRPRWFIAGTMDLSLKYLFAKLKHSPSAYFFWWFLEWDRKFRCHKSMSAKLTYKILMEIYPPISRELVWISRLNRLSLLLRRIIPKAIIALLRKMKRSLNSPVEKGSPSSTTEDAIVSGDDSGNLVKRQSVNEKEADGGTLKLIPGLTAPWTHRRLAELFSEFDVIQCYATYTAIPYAVPYSPYVAYEHGTIREIPFRNDDEGRLCAASYRAAARVCVTNTDNIGAAKRLGIPDEKIVRLPHAFDDRKLARFAAENPAFVLRDGGPTTFFAPARQDWVDRNPSLAKNNDTIFKAMRLLENEGRCFKLIAVAWGRDLEASKSLCADLHISHLVEWVAPMNKKSLWQFYLQSHAVVDQFCSPALGGVSFEVMALGRRLISHLDKAQCVDFFGVEPPIFYASDDKELAMQMCRVINDRNDVAEKGRAALAWMQQYHSADRITALQLKAYRELIA